MFVYLGKYFDHSPQGPQHKMSLLGREMDTSAPEINRNSYS